MGHRDKGQCVTDPGRSLNVLTFVDETDIPPPNPFFSTYWSKCCFTITEKGLNRRITSHEMFS